MALTRKDSLKFVFENSNGTLYDVEFNNDGVGVGREQLTGKRRTAPGTNLDATEVTLTVDGASLSAWRSYHNSRRAYAAVYNTAQDLNSLLTA